MIPNHLNNRRAFCEQIEYSLPRPSGPQRLTRFEKAIIGLGVAIFAFILTFHTLSVFAASAPVDRPPQELVLGWWQMDVKQAAELKGLGINTAFGTVSYGGVMSKAQYEEGLSSRGMGFVTEPDLARLATEASQPFRRGWNQRDEADFSAHQGQPGYTLPDLAAIYRTCKAANPLLPVYLNLSGAAFENLYYDGRKIRTDVSPPIARPFWHSAADGGYMAWGDRLSFDKYLWTSGKPGAFFITRRLLDRVWEWGGGRDVLLYVETCPQGKPVPFTADDYEAQVMQAVMWCAQRGIRLRGIIYFAHTFNPATGAWTSFDGTSPAVKARMGELHKRLDAWVNGKVIELKPQPTTQPTPAPVVVTPAVGSLEERVTALEAWRRIVAGGN